jgi:hypothetical protein
MTPRILVTGFIALAAVLGAKLTALLLFAAAVLVTGAHLLPLLTAVAILGTVLVLAERVASITLRTGWGIVPARKARAAW